MAQTLLTDTAQADKAADTLAGRILIIIAAIVVIAAVIVAVFGLPALGMLGLVATAVVWATLLSIMMGN